MRNPHEESQKRLQHIQKAINDIEKYVEQETEGSFCEKNILQDAVLMQFMVIGEAIIHVEHDILEKYNYPWYKVRSFRNMIAHEYYNIKMIAVWGNIEKDLPVLKTIINDILKNEFKDF